MYVLGYVITQLPLFGIAGKWEIFALVVVGLVLSMVACILVVVGQLSASLRRCKFSGRAMLIACLETEHVICKHRKLDGAGGLLLLSQCVMMGGLNYARITSSYSFANTTVSSDTTHTSVSLVFVRFCLLTSL